MTGILEGEIAWSEGNLEAAANAFRDAVKYYENLNYDEPEPLPFSPRHWLGAAYMEMEAYENALEQYQKDLSDHPYNIWGLWGTQQAMNKLDKSSEDIDRDLNKAFSFADIWLPNTKL
jgi:tetratricopeptide (TPR) repeat protein